VKNKEFIAEEVLKNHPKLEKLNSTSLNTIRIVTIRTKNSIEFIFAGLRIGVPGQVIDNISKGGGVAAIDIDKGVVISDPNTKKTISGENVYNNVFSIKGFILPMWEETLNLVRTAALVLPEMRYIAWDVAITDKGPALIEGNHSSGNTVIQAHLGVNEEGLKPKVKAILKNMKYNHKTK
jgi:hypothetical protein